MGLTTSATNTNKTHDSNFKKKYKLGGYIASGTFATVKHCSRIRDGKHFAVKIVKKRDCTRNELLLLGDEIDIYSTLSHPHIITLEDVFETDKHTRMVLELCNNQTLSDITNYSPNGRLAEIDCAHIVQIIGNTLKYLHSQQIVHRDLKPENILFTKDNVLKLTDFGSAFTALNRSQFTTADLNGSYCQLPSFRMTTMIGTPNYVAPEVLSGLEYSYRVDLWSLGVVLFECIAGYHPFYSRRAQKKGIAVLYAAIISGNYKMLSVWDSIDKDANDLVKKLLCVDPKERITMDQILEHPFIIKYSENDIINRFAVKDKPSGNDNIDNIDNIEDKKKNDRVKMVKQHATDNYKYKAGNKKSQLSVSNMTWSVSNMAMMSPNVSYSVMYELS